MFYIFISSYLYVYEEWEADKEYTKKYEFSTWWPAFIKKKLHIFLPVIWNKSSGTSPNAIGHNKYSVTLFRNS